jgi:hypothetical protein
LYFRRFVAVALQALQVAASTEQTTFTRDHHTSNFGAGFGYAKGLYASRVHFWAQSIAMLGVAQGQNECATFAGTEQLSGHALFLCV